MSNDLISKHEVVDTLERVDWYHINDKGEMVQGSSSEHESWYRHDDIFKAIEAIPFAEPVNKNAISRGGLLKSWNELSIRGRTEFDQVIMTILALPSAEQIHGEWVSNHDGSWNCSECGLRVFVYAKGNFCPNCGAKMMGGDGNE